MEILIRIDEKDVNEYNAHYFSEHHKAKKPRIKSPAHPTLNWYVRADNKEVNNVKQAWKDFIV